MSYRDFTFPEVETDLGLRMVTEHLFRSVPPVTPSADLLARLVDGVELGLGINTEKGRSEFIVAPVLSEFRRLVEKRHAVFSGVVFDVDPKAGLNGGCVTSSSPVAPASWSSPPRWWPWPRGRTGS